MRKEMKITTGRLLELKGGLTLRSFANKCGIGDPTMYNYLNGRTIPSDMLVRIINATGCDANWLLGVKTIPEGNAKVIARSCLDEMRATAKSMVDFCDEIII